MLQGKAIYPLNQSSLKNKTNHQRKSLPTSFRVNINLQPIIDARMRNINLGNEPSQVHCKLV